ncbi:MAG: polyprenyl synthetase family protein [Thermodesulfobacteriota bacterium]|tara:strand:+ start:601 stop:1482 length:882 start_codon:yes stop_codon:yes gene_type:complete
MNIATSMINSKKEIDAWIKEYLNQINLNSKLKKAIVYSVTNGGKRIRPFLTSSLSKDLKLKKTIYKRASIAIEFIHSYSLIHDDLPQMDNDDLRRGKLTTHKKFDEATAILAGNCLFSLAIEILADKKTHSDSKVRSNLIKLISNYSGVLGLMHGQSLDLQFEKKSPSQNQIMKMYELKTSKLFQFAIASPFILSKRSRKEISTALTYGKNFGLIYQITDDILDYEGDIDHIGKTPMKDIVSNKKTMVAKIGRNKAIELCTKLANECTNNRSLFGSDKFIYKNLIFNLIKRTY